MWRFTKSLRCSSSLRNWRVSGITGSFLGFMPRAVCAAASPFDGAQGEGVLFSGLFPHAELVEA
jgi:hypothetical protein